MVKISGTVKIKISNNNQNKWVQKVTKMDEIFLIVKNKENRNTVGVAKINGVKIRSSDFIEGLVGINSHHLEVRTIT